MTEGMPEGFPPLTLGIMRALCVVDGKDGSGQKDLIKCLDEIYDGFWVKHRKMHDSEILKEVLATVLGKERSDEGLFTTISCFLENYTSR